MFLLIPLWILFGTLSIGVALAYFYSMSRNAGKSWDLHVDYNYAPKVSIIVPTFNEANVIRLKLLNLLKLDYPKSHTQIIVVDSNSDDGTLEIAGAFAKQSDAPSFLLLSSSQRGKSAALNISLEQTEGDVILISDADCFYPSNVLTRSIPFLSDPSVGAVSGPKVLFKDQSIKVVRVEDAYLKSMNAVKIGESKTGFTTLFEGGFSCYKKGALSSFDPYLTGSDDCGTLIAFAEKSYKSIVVPEATFFTTFPSHWSERLRVKIRRANQLVRVYSKYLQLLLKNKIPSHKRVIVPNVFIYLFSPFFFVLFLSLTIGVFVEYPVLAFSLLIFLVPTVGSLALDVVQSFTLLFFSSIAAAFGKKFVFWEKPADRQYITEELLRRYDLV